MPGRYWYGPGFWKGPGWHPGAGGFCGGAPFYLGGRWCRWWHAAKPYDVGWVGYGTLVHARLGIACENSGKLVTTIRKRARELAVQEDKPLVITDGPPGIGCPVIASLSGVSAALLVAEPTLSGIHDLERVLAVCRHFHVTPLVCINRCDLDWQNTREIERICHEEGIELAGNIPFDRAVTEAMANRVPVVENAGSRITGAIEEVWHAVNRAM